ncbi:putative O-fucosyltransferase, plant [Helianthus debilis subsp. tardiflorus]
MKRTRTPENEERNSVGCLAMFGSLELQPEVCEVVDSIVERLKTLSRKLDIEFVAVDLRLDFEKMLRPRRDRVVLKEVILGSDSSEYEKVIDFYVCSESDVFVPAISGLFYANVAGKRIGSGKTKIAVPDVCIRWF